MWADCSNASRPGSARGGTGVFLDHRQRFEPDRKR